MKVFDVDRGGRGRAGPRSSSAPARDNSAFMAACTPSRLNFEGDPEHAEPAQRRLRRRATATSSATATCSPSGAPAATSTGCELDETGRRVVSSSTIDASSSSPAAAVGIGAAIAEELGRSGAFVVTVDPGVDGRRHDPGSGDAEDDHRAADRRRRRAGPGVEHLGHRRRRGPRAVRRAGRRVRRARRGGQRRRHQPPDRLRRRRRGRLACGARACTSTATSTCSRAALPIMAAAGHGRILGVTSGSGWRPADAGAYSCAKRAVAALTWQHRPGDAAGRDRQRAVADRGDPHGARRARRQAGAGNQTGRLVDRRRVARARRRCRRPSTSDRSAPTSRARRSRRGAAGRSCSPTAPRSRGSSRRGCSRWRAPATSASLLAVLESFGADGARAGRGRAGEQRRRQPAPRHRVRRRRARRAARRRRDRVPSSSPTSRARRRQSTGALAARGVVSASIDAARDELRRPRPSSSATAAAASGPIDAVVVALAGAARASPAAEAGSRCSTSTPGSPSRSAPTPPGSARSPTTPPRPTGRSGSSRVIDATTAGGRSRAQAAAQLSRAAHPATDDRVDAFAIERRGRRRRQRGRPRARRPPGVRRRRRRAVRRRAGRRPPTGSGCAATRTRRARSRSAVPPSPTGSTTRSASMVSGRQRTEDGVMAAPIERIVDAHIHLWDPANADWYPYLAGQQRARHGRHLGDVPPVRPAHVLRRVGELERREVRARRRRDRAALGRRDRASCEELAEATGHPDAIIGGIVPAATRSPTPSGCSTSRWQSPRFRGIRPMGGGDGRPARRGPARARGARPGLRADGASRPARVGGRRRWPTSTT